MVILLLRQCNTEFSLFSKPGKTDVIYEVKSDTTYITKDSIIFKKGNTITIHDVDTVAKPGDTVFVANANYDFLKTQYDRLVKAYKVRNIYVDSVAIDTFGYLNINDTIQYNNISSRTLKYNFSIPLVSDKIVSEPKNLFYAGGGLGIHNSTIHHIQASLLYKPKKNNVFGVHIGVGTSGRIYYGGSAYWLINNK